MSLLRQPILLLARSQGVKKLVSTMPVSSSIVTSYVPGEATADAVSATSGLVDDGLRVTLDYLGEDTTDAAQADATVAAYKELLADLAAKGLAPQRRGLGQASARSASPSPTTATRSPSRTPATSAVPPATPAPR